MTNVTNFAYVNTIYVTRVIHQIKYHSIAVFIAKTLKYLSFLPRDASAERGDATVSCPSVRLSACNVQVPCSNTLEFFENNFTAE